MQQAADSGFVLVGRDHQGSTRSPVRKDPQPAGAEGRSENPVAGSPTLACGARSPAHVTSLTRFGAAERTGRPRPQLGPGQGPAMSRRRGTPGAARVTAPTPGPPWWAFV